MVASGFPGDQTAEINLVPVDRVVAGILAALAVPEAIGHRIHLATDNRIRSEDMVRITREELGANVRLADPTLYRNVTLPIVKARAGQARGSRSWRAPSRSWGRSSGRTANGASPSTTSATTCGSWACPSAGPTPEHAFRMLCRHNRYVQEYGRVRDPDEVARREHVWGKAVDDIELRTGHEVGAIPPEEFRRLWPRRSTCRTFRLERPAGKGATA